MSATEPVVIDRPPDEPPDDPPPFDTGGDFDPEYPGSTPEAPYGFKDDGTPYRRRPKGTAKKSGKSAPRNSVASDVLARSAAGLLAQMNTLTGFSLAAFGLNETAESIVEANKRFEEMAYGALLNDPALCKKILSAGTNSGAAQLTMAYVTLALSIFPAARNDIKRKRNNDESD